MAPKLEKVFDIRGYMDQKNTANVGATKGGPHRIVVPINGGFIKGEGLEAEVLPGSGDWLVLDPTTGVCHLDVRIQARTTKGHFIHTHYVGILKNDEKANKILQYSLDAKTTEYGDHYWFNAPVMETSDPDFKWVEETTFVGQGHFVVDEKGFAVEYEIYRVTN